MPPKFEVLDYQQTPLGALCLRRREIASEPGVFVTEVTLDHEFLMSSLLTDSERSLATTALAMHTGSGLRVLIGGLGLGYTADATLRDARVSAATVVEFLPQVIGWQKAGLTPLAEVLNADQRLALREGDIYGLLAEPPADRWDLILIDVDHSPEDVLGDQSQGFYTTEGLRRAAAHLNPNGILGVWSYAESSPLAGALREVFPEVHVERVTAWNHLNHTEQTDWLFFGRV